MLCWILVSELPEICSSSFDFMWNTFDQIQTLNVTQKSFAALFRQTQRVEVCFRLNQHLKLQPVDRSLVTQVFSQHLQILDLPARYIWTI